jgi:hypothetical protein
MLEDRSGVQAKKPGQMEGRVPKSARLKSYGEGRLCELEGCTTVLAQANKGPFCFLHTPKTKPRVRGRKEPYLD